MNTAEINPILLKACVVIDGIAFEVVGESEAKKILAVDLYNPVFRASFVVRENNLILSVSSFREKTREQELLEAVQINNALLIEEVQSA